MESRWPFIFKSIGIGNKLEKMNLRELLIDYDKSKELYEEMYRKFSRFCPLGEQEKIN